MYNYREIQEAIKKVEQFNTTTDKKALHNTKLFEIKKLLNELITVNTIFTPEFYYTYKNYKKAIEIEYNNTSKNNLDSMLSRIKKNILNDLEQIKRLAS